MRAPPEFLLKTDPSALIMPLECMIPPPRGAIFLYTKEFTRLKFELKLKIAPPIIF
jgi:hypothetical protein